MVDQILVPMDGSEQAERALEFALEQHPEADVTVLHAYGMGDAAVAQGAVVVMTDEVEAAAEEHAEEIFDRAREIAADAGHEGTLETVAEEGDPETVVPEHAADADIVYVGSHGREGAARVLLGSVAEQVVRRSPSPVMVVK
jgi:nucleotide-binding universal stress UspA family protein